MELDPASLASALPGYAIGEEIGRGGWGSVWRAHHVALGRDVAVKLLPSGFAPDQHALERFISEARLIAQLDHPHIVKVYDFVEFQGSWLIVMELLSGGTLFEHFRAGIRADQACGVALAMCAALEAAHARGILHRDLKPDNILFTTNGVARLSDFGIAKELDGDVQRTRAGEVIGTPTYMSPEQALGRPVGVASDIYSLGIVLYELLGGRAPFPAAETPMEKLFQHARETPIPLAQTAPTVPPAIAAIVMRSLEKDPSDRFFSAQAFGVALAEACAQSYGSTWLESSGTLLMGGGAIEAAAVRGPALEVVPAPVPEPPGEGPPLSPPLEPPAAPPSGPPEVPVPPVSAVPTPSPFVPQPAGTGGRRGPLLALLGVLVLLALAAAALLVLRSPTTSSTASAPPGTTTASSLASSTSASAGMSSAPTTTTTAPNPTTTVKDRSCPGGARCIFIDDVKVVGDSYVIGWTAVGFQPSFAEGFFHAHFFWDIYSADQAGTNAKTFGVDMGVWEITDQSPFKAKTEILVSKRPAPANRICVTVGNFAHAVPEPSRFDCFPLPDVK